MTKSSSYPIDANFQKNALINRDQYDAMYQASITHPEMFWNVQANKFLSWEKSSGIRLANAIFARAKLIGFLAEKLTSQPTA